MHKKLCNSSAWSRSPKGPKWAKNVFTISGRKEKTGRVEKGADFWMTARGRRPAGGHAGARAVLDLLAVARRGQEEAGGVVRRASAGRRHLPSW